jgi:hypothetical protein
VEKGLASKGFRFVGMPSGTPQLAGQGFGFQPLFDGCGK